MYAIALVLLISFIIYGGMTAFDCYQHYQVAKRKKERIREEISQEQEEQKRRENDPRHILERWYNAKTEEHKKSRWQNIKRCIDNDAEFRQSLEYLRSLESFNEASYLGYVDDTILVAAIRTKSNLRRIVNYLIIDGCIDNIEKDPSKDHMEKIDILVERNEAILERVKVLLDEAVGLVNHYNKGEDEDVIASLNTSITVIRDFTAEKPPI